MDKMQTGFQRKILDTIVQWGGVILGICYFVLEKEIIEEKIIAFFLGVVIVGMAYVLRSKDTIREILWCIICTVLLLCKKSFPVRMNEERVFIVAITIAIFHIRRRYLANGTIALSRLIGKACLSVLIAFQFLGYQCFYEEGIFVISVLRGMAFSLFVCWSYLLIGASEMILSPLHISCEKPANVRFFFLICFVLILPGIVILIAYFPGIYSTDVITCWEDALKIADVSSRSDVHSFLYVLILSFFAQLTNDCSLVTVVFMIAYALVTGSFLYYLHQKGIEKKWIYFIIAYFTIFPNNIFMRVALWKDVPFTIAIISLTHAVAKIIFDGTLTKAKDIVQFIMAFIAVALLRSNGLVAVALVGVMIAIGSIKKKLSKRNVYLYILSLCLVIVIKIPLYQCLDVKGGPEGFACIPFMDGIWANVYVGNDIASDTEAYLKDIMPLEDWTQKYISQYCNLYVIPDSYRNKNLDLSSSVVGWVKLLIKYPGTTIGARLIKTDMIWSVFKNDGADLRYNVSFHALQAENAEKFGWYWGEKTHVLRIFFWRYMNYFERFFSVFYRGGLNLTIWMLLIWNSVYNSKKGMWTIAAPALGCILALMMASCYPDYRYIWVMFLLTPFFILCYIICNSNVDSKMELYS